MAKTISPGQTYLAALRAGFNPTQAEIMTAIAGAESNYTPVDLNNNPSTGDLSYGLWQINMLGSMGPERRQTFGLRSNNDLYDPATNARAAYAISGKGKDFTPWTTYTNGAYLDFMPAAAAAATENGASSVAIIAAGTNYQSRQATANLGTATVGQTCRYPVNVPLGITTAKFCADKPLAILVLAAGGLVTLSGLAIVVLALNKATGVGKTLAGGAKTVTAGAAIIPGVGAAVKTAGVAAARTGRNRSASKAATKNAATPGTKSNDLRAAEYRRASRAPATRTVSGINAGRRVAPARASTTRRRVDYGGNTRPTRAEAGAGF